MSHVAEWSRVAGDNVDISLGGWPEKMQRHLVNNQARKNLASLRSFFEDADWFDRLSEQNATFTVTKIDTDTVRVTDLLGTDATEHFVVGSWCRISGTGTPAAVYGSVKSVSAYGGGPSIDVEFQYIVDGAYAAASLPSGAVALVESYYCDRVRGAAFHPIGVTTGQLPAQIPHVDLLGDVAWETEGSGNGLVTQTVDLLAESDLAVLEDRLKFVAGGPNANYGTARVGITNLVGITFPVTPDSAKKFLVTAAAAVFMEPGADSCSIQLHLGPLGTVIDPAVRTCAIGSGATHFDFWQGRLSSIIVAPDAADQLSVSVFSPGQATNEVRANGYVRSPIQLAEEEFTFAIANAETFLRIERIA